MVMTWNEVDSMVVSWWILFYFCTEWVLDWSLLIIRQEQETQLSNATAWKYFLPQGAIVVSHNLHSPVYYLAFYPRNNIFVVTSLSTKRLLCTMERKCDYRSKVPVKSCRFLRSHKRYPSIVVFLPCICMYTWKKIFPSNKKWCLKQ